MSQPGPLHSPQVGANMPLICRKRPAMSQAITRVCRGTDSNIIDFCVYTYITRNMAAQQTTHTATAAPVGEGKRRLSWVRLFS